MKDKRPVVMLANGHPPFDTRIFVKEAGSLTVAGYEVSIILPHTRDEYRNGIHVYAVKKATRGLGKLFINPFRILRKALSQSSRSIFCIHDSDILGVGIILKLLGRKVIYDAHEDTPLQISYQHWIPGLMKKPYAYFYYCLEKISGWLFDAIIIAEPVIGRYFPESKTYLVRNFSLVESFKNHTGVYGQRSNTLVYVGLLTQARGLFEMLDGAKRAKEKVDFRFLLGGDFSPPSLKEQVTNDYDADFAGWIPYEELAKVLYDAKVGIIVPQPNPRYKTNYPVKLFEYMAAALPVIASREGESATFVEEAKCGILVDPGNLDEIANAIVWLLTNPQEAEAMGKRGQQLIFDKYNWEGETKVLLEVYGNL